MASYVGTYQDRRAKTRSQFRRKKFIEQKLMGLIAIAVTVAIFWLASKGTTLEDKDATAALLTGPLGLYLLFTRHLVIV